MDTKNYNIVDGFNAIAPAYDLANDAMTLGFHRIWRKKLCKTALQNTPLGGKILDVATGTGDVVLGLLNLGKDVRVTGVDASEGMLRIAQQKLSSKADIFSKKYELLFADGLSLPFKDNSYDTVTICWGIRNMRPYTTALREVLRVLKPGGHAFLLESGPPEFKLVQKFYKTYAKILPFIGGKIANYRPAYQFYTASVDTFPCGSQFVADLFDTGFTHCHYETLGASVVYLYFAQKPALNL